MWSVKVSVNHDKKILNLESVYKLQIGKFMYQYRSGLLPYSFNNMFLVTRQVHSYGTRSLELFYLPQCRTSIRTFSIRFQGLKFFNSLSFEIRNVTSTAFFCCKLKHSSYHKYSNLYIYIYIYTLVYKKVDISEIYINIYTFCFFFCFAQRNRRYIYF